MSNKVKSTCTESAHQSTSTGTMQRGEVQLWAGMPTIAEKWDKTSLSLMEGEFAQGSRTINRAQTRKNLMVPLRLPLRTRAPSLPPSLSLSLYLSLSCLYYVCTDARRYEAIFTTSAIQRIYRRPMAQNFWTHWTGSATFTARPHDRGTSPASARQHCPIRWAVRGVVAHLSPKLPNGFFYFQRLNRLRNFPVRSRNSPS